MHVVHHPGYVARPQPGQHSFSKYALVMDILRGNSDLVEHCPEPAPRRWLEAAHDPQYVSQVLGCAVPRDIERRIGFAITDDVAQRAQLSPGGTWLAARLALEHGFAANAAGGSHHALPSTGAGFCVFNDLAVAALRLTGEGTAARILIVDLDVHQGDGTATVLAGHDTIMTLSLHAAKNFPVRKARSTMDVELPDGLNDDAYMSALKPALDIMVDRAKPDLILYQAGVDVHRDDRLGRLKLSDDGLRRRDEMVAGKALECGIPIASTMGGGYGADTAAIALRHAAVIQRLASMYRSRRPLA